ncbi:hypothetical protein ACFYU8_18310 [Brevibacillus sp. NPDC003359]|uniref:hypothetical protein n=1 Tax=unclassified Brevibacillus TaxID=2684853 RepID=UPI0036C14722
MSTSFVPLEVSDVDLVLGLHDIKKLLPDWYTIPTKFKEGHTKWNRLYRYIRYRFDVPGTFRSFEGVDFQQAWRHVRTVMKSSGINTEYKEAACAYLLSLWIENWELNDDSMTDGSHYLMSVWMEEWDKTSWM